MSNYVYIAGPYSRGDPVINVGKAIKAAEQLVEFGFIPFVPHLTHLWHLINPHEIEYWYKYDNEWLLKCNAVLRLPGDSRGADAECRLAEKNNIPVFLSIVDLCLWCSE